MGQTAKALLKTLVQQDSLICGRYAEYDHSMTVFRAIPGAIPSFVEWLDICTDIVNRATKRQTITGELYVDPTAPRLKKEPQAAALYLNDLRAYCGAVNVLCGDPFDFGRAEAEAQAIAAKANLQMMRLGRFPTADEVGGLVFVQSTGPAASSVVQGLLDRINSTPI